MSKDDYLNEAEVCELLNIALPTLQSRRSRGTNHPPFIKVGRKILFPRKDFQRWFNATHVPRAQIKAAG